jgi:tetratricopeptide (TPR) repeat protein
MPTLVLLCLFVTSLLWTAPLQAYTRVAEGPSTSVGEADSPYPEYTRLVRSGEARAKSGDYKGAIEEYDRALALGAPTPLAESSLLTYRAGALWHLGRSNEAIADHDRAIKVDANAFALWARGETFRKLARFTEALKDYDSTIKLAPGFSPSQVGRAIVLWRLGRIKEAQETFDRAIAIKADPWALTWRGMFLRAQEKIDAAISDYSKAIELDPSHFSAFLNRANAYAVRGEYAKALDDYETALRLKSDDPAVYRGRGWVFARQGLTDRARADNTRALELERRIQGRSMRLKD